MRNLEDNVKSSRFFLFSNKNVSLYYKYEYQ